MAEAMRQTIVEMLKGIERYNPDNLSTLEKYVEIQSRENAYDLEANLAVLKLYQLNPQRFSQDITCQILLKALTNFPHTDFVLCKCLLTEKIMQEEPINQIMYLGDILEQCDFQHFWDRVLSMPELCNRIVGFQDSVRKFVCHVVGITFQTIDKGLLAQLLGGIDDSTLKHWVKKYGWKEESKNVIFIANQDENIKTKNITEKIDFENVAGLMAACL
ncbi:eukaryotic translation initiation factor 3 subunit K isoform X2 [Neodiprion pinetum]|uniref:Eukaryotic translation initiation factor 3 subunit K n=1 Tax=Neodiprion lecontei TaxID=441921 RepID=A0A6J0CEU8_NEOLC|nr:eukaryotic translation initiation factor 3 subunit K isoform X2 [Neodiprion lecontei]XP_046410073.1 eukaryotic translation initiation factor 3 subunit K isoform X2 [Neodiprion fabricii]XP_046467208.1 eukaryotic translation initiation factor 3 subunit K isoform X2 [Neodiprion pinetum]XP_046606498.1 eukaryotic translation initiation factor 3 subunit K isoform X2 [Neodiprion virginianus]